MKDIRTGIEKVMDGYCIDDGTNEQFYSLLDEICDVVRSRLEELNKKVEELEKDAAQKPSLGDIYHAWCRMEIDRAGFDWSEFVTTANNAAMQYDNRGE